MQKLYILLIFALSNTLLYGQELKIHAEVAGNPNKPIIFFIHGSPGSAQSFSKLYRDEELKQAALLVAIDRPGYGSTPLAAKGTLSVEEQAKIFIRYIEENYPRREIILVGHSYGAVVAAKMAALSPFKSVILLSTVANPSAVKDDKKIKLLKMLSGIANSTVCSSVIPNSMLACQRELSGLEKDIASLLKDWQKISSSVTFVHGRNDRVVSSENAKLAKSKIGKDSTKIHIIPNAGHQLLENNVEEIKTILLSEASTNRSGTPCSLYSLFP